MEALLESPLLGPRHRQDLRLQRLGKPPPRRHPPLRKPAAYQREGFLPVFFLRLHSMYTKSKHAFTITSQVSLCVRV